MKIKMGRILMLLCLFENLDLLSMNKLVKNGTVEFFDDTNFLNINRKKIKNILATTEDAQKLFKREFVYNAITSQFSEPLINAVESGNNAAVKLLIDLGAYTYINKNGCPLTVLAARHGFPKIIILLAKSNKYLIDSIDHQGKTPLIWAVHAEHENIVNILIGLGANIFIQDFDGRTALDYASYRASLPNASQSIKNIHKEIKIEYSRYTEKFFEDQETEKSIKPIELTYDSDNEQREKYSLSCYALINSCIKSKEKKKTKQRKKVRFADSVSVSSSCSTPTTPEQAASNSK